MPFLENLIHLQHPVTIQKHPLAEAAAVKDAAADEAMAEGAFAEDDDIVYILRPQGPILWTLK